MYATETKIRVRYAETDRMGYVYYGNYATYFEIGRVEALRNLGISYRDLEDEGFLMPVIEYRIRYMKPAFYDDQLTLKTIVREMPAARIHFDYELYNEKEDLLNVAETTLVFLKKETGKPCPVPGIIKTGLEEYL